MRFLLAEAQADTGVAGDFPQPHAWAILYHNHILTSVRSRWTGNNRCGIDLSFVLSKLMNSPGKIIAF